MRQSSQHPTDRVAQLAIIIADGFEDFRTDALIVGIVHARHPQAQDVGARGADDVLREGLVPQRLGHFAAALVEREAMGQHDVEGRATARAAAFEKGGLEPAAMLVGAFEIHHRIRAAVDAATDAGQSGKVHGVFEDVGVGAAGIEPDFDQVIDLVVVVGMAPCAQEPLLRALGEPGVGAFLFIGLGDSGVHFLVEKDFVPALAHENRQRHAPGALPREAPSRACSRPCL